MWHAAVVGLVVVADHEEVVLRRGEQLNEPKLGGVDVLELVDAQVAETGLPPDDEAAATGFSRGGVHACQA